MKQSKNPSNKIGEQETEQTENTTTKEQVSNRIADLQKVIQQRINDLSGEFQINHMVSMKHRKMRQNIDKEFMLIVEII